MKSATIAVVDERDSDERAETDPEAAPSAERARKLRETARRADSRPQLVASAKFIRRLLPYVCRQSDVA